MLKDVLFNTRILSSWGINFTQSYNYSLLKIDLSLEINWRIILSKSPTLSQKAQLVYLEPTLFSEELDVCLELDLRETITSPKNNIGNHQKPLSLFKKKRDSIYDRWKGRNLSSLHLTSENFSDLEYGTFGQALTSMFLMMQLAKDSNDPRLLHGFCLRELFKESSLRYVL